jgi:hypothetical protein
MTESNESTEPCQGTSPSPRGAGGTPGGVGLFVVGLVLAVAGVWFLLDSVRVTSADFGLFSELAYGYFGAGSALGTTSMGILFVPFFAGVATLFYDARLKLGWWLAGLGLAIIVVEILSRLRFGFNMKVTHLLLMLALIAAGTGCMLRALRDGSAGQAKE